jgi:NAD-dependent dihydropyrimidine dehydrogenase PreA subunit/flavodoxin
MGDASNTSNEENLAVSTEIYYFSGTGNSLYVAKELQKRIPDASLTPVVSLLDEDAIQTQAETVGFVFPIHLTTLPIPMREFVEKLDPTSAKYIFAIGTRMGTFCLADIALENALKEKGKHLDAYFILNMAMNTPTGLVPGPGDKGWVSKVSTEKVSALDAEVHTRLDAIQGIIVNQVPDPKDDSPRRGSLLRRLLFMLLAFGARSTGGTEIPYITDSTCTSCRTCEKICPSKKIKLVDGKPVWQKEVQCYFCYACFNFCPTQSILVGKKYVQKDGRYFHPGITANDIAGQKATD